MSTANTLSDLKAAQGGSAALSVPSIDDLTPIVGQLLTATTGSPRSWQWTRDGVDIGGATNPTYTVQVADIGTVIDVYELQVTPTAVSAPGTATGLVPSNATTFAVNGTGQENGCVYGLANGTESATITATNGGSISALTGNTGLSTGNNTCTFTVTAADGVTALSVSITLRVLLPAPTIASVVQNFPTPTVGNVMTLTINSADCTTFTYVWKADGTAITGATGATYTATRADAMGKAITCVVTGHNETGSTSPETSDATALVTGAPVCTVNPVATCNGANAPSGPATAGVDTLSTTDGTWTGYPTPTVGGNALSGYLWSPGTGATNNASTYAPTGAEISDHSCTVSYTNSVGTVAASSNAISVIA